MANGHDEDCDCRRCVEAEDRFWRMQDARDLDVAPLDAVDPLFDAVFGAELVGGVFEFDVSDIDDAEDETTPIARMEVEHG